MADPLTVREEAERLAVDSRRLTAVQLREAIAAALLDFRARARREALEEAAKAACVFCREGVLLKSERSKHHAIDPHRNMTKAPRCRSWRIRALAAEPGGKNG